MILLLPVGYAMMLQMACSNTLIQVMVPDALRGRVMAVYSMMFMGMAPIGALLGGGAGRSVWRANGRWRWAESHRWRVRDGSGGTCPRFAWKRGA